MTYTSSANLRTRSTDKYVEEVDFNVRKLAHIENGQTYHSNHYLLHLSDFNVRKLADVDLVAKLSRRR